MQIYQNHKKHTLPPPQQSFGGRELRVPRKVRNLERTENGSLIMSEQNLKQICEMQGLYQFPEMNKKLYLHYKVIQQIGGLQKYINLKTLYLENNVITKIGGLSHLAQLQNLFLQNNMIKKIENLDKLRELRILNLSNNNIFVVEGLSELPQLQNLTLNKNFLSDFHSLEHLGQCSLTLTSLDISENKVEPDERLFDLISQIKCVYLSGNPLVRQINHYRRTIVGRLPNLLYLDQRAVDKEERILAQAWVKEGQTGFKKARESIMAFRKQKRQEQRAEVMKNIDVHRKNKINVFERNIIEFEREIEKLRGYMRQPGNQSQIFFYQTRVSEFMQKIRQNQQFIDSIYKRMGIQPLPPIYTLELPPETQQEQQVQQRRQQEGNMLQIPEQVEQQNRSQGQSQKSVSQQGSQNESQNSQLNSNSSASQESSLKTYYSNMDELD